MLPAGSFSFYNQRRQVCRKENADKTFFFDAAKGTCRKHQEYFSTMRGKSKMIKINTNRATKQVLPVKI